MPIKKLIIPVIFSVFFMISLFSVYLIDYFRVKKVVIIGQTSSITGLNIFNHQNLISLDTNRAAAELVKDNYFIDKVILRKKYPDEVVLNLTFKLPVLNLICANGQFSLDQKGIIIPVEEKEDWPVIENKNSLCLYGQKADWRVLKVYELILEINNLGYRTLKVTVDDSRGAYIFSENPESELVIPYAAEVSSTATSLQIIISRFRIEGKLIKSIDFRFDNPVITFENGEKISSSY